MLKITIISLNNKLPDWIITGSNEYLKRFKEGLQVKLIELPLTHRNKNSDINRVLDKESAQLLSSIPNGAFKIALDSRGTSFNSEELALKITKIQQYNSHLCLLIGGPEGLSQEVLNICADKWSLSKLTLPHPLVRIFLLETLYRSWSIMNNHPYHK